MLYGHFGLVAFTVVTPMSIVQWQELSGDQAKIIGNYNFPMSPQIDPSLTHFLSVVRCPTVYQPVVSTIGGQVLERSILADNRPISDQTLLDNRTVYIYV